MQRLLRCYRDAVELAAEPPPSRRTGFAPADRALARSRPIRGLERMVVEHIRARLALIDRRYARRLALGEHDPNDEEDRSTIALFVASLPAPRSRFWVVLPLLAVIAISQGLLALLLRSQDGVARSAEGRLLPEEVLNQLTAVFDLNPANFTKVVSTLLHSSAKVSALALGILTLSVYLVLRPLLPAYRLKRMILGLPGAIVGRASRTPLGARAQLLGVHREELALCAALDMAVPGEVPLDLWVKGTLVGILGALAALMFLAPSEPALGIFFLVLAATRLGWLVRERRRRRPQS